MGKGVDKLSLHEFCTKNFIILSFSSDPFVFMARPQNMLHRIHSCLSYLDFREGNCLSHKKSAKTRNFMYNTYGELSTICHPFDVICALVIKLNLVTSSVVKMYMSIKMYEHTLTRRYCFNLVDECLYMTS